MKLFCFLHFIFEENKPQEKFSDNSGCINWLTVEPGLSAFRKRPYVPIDKEQSARPGPWDWFSFVLLSTSRAFVRGGISLLRLVEH